MGTYFSKRNKVRQSSNELIVPPSPLPPSEKDLEKNDKRSSISSASDIVSTKKSRLFCCISGDCWHEWRVATEDWIFLALLGIIMTLISVGMDYVSGKMQGWHLSWYEDLKDMFWMLSFLEWISWVVGTMALSVVFVHYVAVQAIGSGIPELKTILRGVILKEYLAFRTLVAKVVGLTICLGSGLPMGKEGPFVHIASVVAALLNRLMTGTEGVYQNESRSSEMLVAGCAVGVACTFSSPVGGVLFSIEVTSTYFAVRNYWRGFFAATCSAVLFRLLKMFGNTDTPGLSVEAHYQTRFPTEDPFLPVELPLFALIGAIMGLTGALFILIHRRTVLFLRKNAVCRMLFQKYWIVYPVVISLFMSSITYPLGLGKYMGGAQTFGHTLADFFLACTWGQTNTSMKNYCNGSVVDFDIHDWTGENGNYSIFVTLAAFQVVFFFFSILVGTLPIPAGVFLPVFVLGAAFGRMAGEGMAAWFPNGLDSDMRDALIYPGVYAVVGSAAFAGAMTHTVSVAVIVFEMTGQLVSLLPVMIAVLIANAVCAYFQPSLYDSMIQLKKLPYLQDIPTTNTARYHAVHAEQFMVSPVRYVSKDSTYQEVQDILVALPKVRAFPMVESKEAMTLVGSVSKPQLYKLLEAKVGTKARREEAAKRIHGALRKVDRRINYVARQSTVESLGLDGSISQGALTMRKRFTVVPVDGQSKSRDNLYSEVPLEKADERLNQRRMSIVAKQSITGSEPDQINLINLSPDIDLNSRGSIDSSGMGKKRSYSGGDLLDANQLSFDNHSTGGFGDIIRSFTTFARRRKSQEGSDEFDLSGDEKTAWEKEMLKDQIDLTTLQVDRAPFQLVEHTSLFKVHSLFALLALNRAYVTKFGRLIGVIGMQELQLALELVRAGKKPEPGESLLPHADIVSLVKKAEEDDIDDILNPRLEVVRSQKNSISNGDSSVSLMPPTLAAALEERHQIEEANLKDALEKQQLQRARAATIGNGEIAQAPPPRIVVDNVDLDDTSPLDPKADESGEAKNLMVAFHKKRPSSPAVLSLAKTETKPIFTISSETGKKETLPVNGSEEKMPLPEFRIDIPPEDERRPETIVEELSDHSTDASDGETDQRY